MSARLAQDSGQTSAAGSNVDQTTKKRSVKKEFLGLMTYQMMECCTNMTLMNTKGRVCLELRLSQTKKITEYKQTAKLQNYRSNFRKLLNFGK